VATTPKAQGGSLGSRLRGARANAGLSQSALERKSGIPKSMLSRYENDRLLPSVPTLRRLAGALGITASSLLERENGAGMLERELARRGISVRSRDEVVRIADIVSEAVGRPRKTAGQ
jgi:transcriptional regulator with XRE-family HTH domain